MLPQVHQTGPAAVAREKHDDSFATMDMDTTDLVHHSAKQVFWSLSFKMRIRLLEGPSILLIVSHSGTPSDYAQQCTAAKGLVAADRDRQLNEQAGSDNRPYAIEFPISPLVTASQAFKTSYEQYPHVSQLPLEMGTILPGYAICVLDWLARCLRSRACRSLNTEYWWLVAGSQPP
jgi:hypothetical protein